MLRDALNFSYKEALKARETQRTATLRLILAALKDRDIAAREKGNYDGVAEADILTMLQSMVKQRRESISMYEQGGRLELAAQEQAEIDVIQSFLPAMLEGEALQKAIRDTIKAVGATDIKGMGDVMAALRTNYAGQMDFAQASGLVKEALKGAA